MDGELPRRVGGWLRISRRGFLGATIAAPLILRHAAAEEAVHTNELRLNFSWNTDKSSLQVTSILRDPDKDGEKPGDTWTLNILRFGPNVAVRLREKKGLPGQSVRYELRFTGARWGRMNVPMLSFHFTRFDDPVAVAKKAPSGTFHVHAEVQGWSTDTDVSATSTFLMGPLPYPDTASSTLRQRSVPFWKVATDTRNASFGQTIGPSRVNNAFKLLFNGQVRYAPPVVKVVELRLHADIHWSVKVPDATSKSVFMWALRPDLNFRSLHLAWAKPADQAQIDPNWMGPVLVAQSGPVTSPDLLQIGGGGGPSVTLDIDGQPAGLHSPIILRGVHGTESSAGRYRTEAAILMQGVNLWTNGRTDESSGPFGPLALRLVEQVEAPVKADGGDWAERGGNLRIEGAHLTNAAARRAETPVGGIQVSGIPEGAVSALSNLDFPRDPDVVPGVSDGVPRDSDGANPDLVKAALSRQGTGPLVAVFTWGEGSASRKRPAMAWAEVHALMLGSDAALPGADHSRLDFAPTDLLLFYAPLKSEIVPRGSAIRLGQTGGGPRARFDLSRATLRAGRVGDLLSLTFRFSDLALVFHPARTELVSLNQQCLTVAPPPLSAFDSGFDITLPMDGEIVSGRSTSAPAPMPDTRPLLSVEFAPQHMLEETLFQPGPPPLPDTALAVVENQPWYYDLRTGAIGPTNGDGKRMINLNSRQQVVEALQSMSSWGVRRVFRSDLQTMKVNVAEGGDTFKEFAERYYRNAVHLANSKGLPRDQLVYIGPFALDPDAMAKAREVWLRYQSDKLRGAIEAMTAGLAASAQNIRDAATLRLPENKVPTNSTDAALLGPPKELGNRLVLEGEIERQVPGYQLLRSYYREAMITAFAAGTKIGDEVVASLDAADIELFYDAFTTPNEPVKKRAFIVRDKYAASLTDVSESPPGYMEGRLANPSRLVFRLSCRDGLAEARLTVDALDAPEDLRATNDEDAADRARPGLPRKRFAFTLAALTNFADLELAVVARAEIVHSADSGGRTDSASRRVINLNAGAMLDHLGYQRGQFLTSAQRLSDITASLRLPGPFETAIEIPARLILSPHQNAVFLTPRPVPGGVYDPDDMYDTDSKGPQHGGQRLWAAELVTAAGDPGLRAIHSPDLAPDYVWQRLHRQNPIVGSQGNWRLPGGGAPLRGPWAPWSIGREQGNGEVPGPKALADAIGDPTSAFDAVAGDMEFCTAIGAYDPKTRSKLQGLIDYLCQRQKVPKNDSIFRAPMDAFDRNELVFLSSVWGLPVVGRRSTSGEILGGSSQVEPDIQDRLVDLVAGSAMYVPKTLGVAEMSLTALGGSLRHDTAFEPPAGALHISDRTSLFGAFSVERWRQWTVLGRDVQVEIVYKGFLFPLGLRASLVKLTERVFMSYRRASGGQVIRAYLNQRLFIRTGKPDKSFPAVGQPLGGRQFPARMLRLLTVQTPDLADPLADDMTSTTKGEIAAGGRFNLGEAPGLAFWPRTARTPLANIRFRFLVDAAATEMPLLFVDNAVANDQAALAKIVKYYNGLAPESLEEPEKLEKLSQNRKFDPAKDLSSCQFDDVKLRYADETKIGTASFETRSWTLRVSGRESDPPTFETLGTGNEVKNQVATDAVVFNQDKFEFSPVLQGADQPPFYPVLDNARLVLRQSERLFGAKIAPLAARFDARYLQDGFPNRPTADKTLPQDTPPPDATVQSDTGRVANPRGIFMTLFDSTAALQDAGSSGDRVGGIMRPHGYPVGCCREGGVVTYDKINRADPHNLFSKLPKEGLIYLSLLDKFAALKNTLEPDQPDTASGLTAPNSGPNVKDRKEVFRQSLGETKLFGLIKISDLIEKMPSKLLEATGLPNLLERIRYGAGQAGDVVRETLVDEVLRPLLRAMRDLQSAWDQLDQMLLEKQQELIGKNAQAPFQALKLSQIFPELTQNLADLIAALADIEDETDDLVFALGLGEVYATGRRFIDALLRVAANPVERFDAALQSRFTTLLTLFKVLTDNPEKLFLQALPILDEINLRGWVIDHIVPPNSDSTPIFGLRSVRLGDSSLSAPDQAVLAKAMSALDWTRGDLRLVLNCFVASVLTNREPWKDLGKWFKTVENPDVAGQLLITVLSKRLNDKIATAETNIANLITARLPAQIEAYRQILADDMDLVADWIAATFWRELLIGQAACDTVVLVKQDIAGNNVTAAFQHTVGFVEIFTGPVVSDASADLCKTVLSPVGSALSALQVAKFTLRPEDAPRQTCTVEKTGELSINCPTPVATETTLPAQIHAVNQKLTDLLGDIDMAALNGACDEIRNALISANLNSKPAETIRDGLKQASKDLTDIRTATSDLYARLINDAILAQELDTRIAEITAAISNACLTASPDLAPFADLERSARQLAQSRELLLKGVMADLLTIWKALNSLMENQVVQRALAAGALGSLIPPEAVQAVKANAKAAQDLIEDWMKNLKDKESDLAGLLGRFALKVCDGLLGIVTNLDTHGQELLSNYDAIKPYVQIDGLRETLTQLGPHKDYLTRVSGDLTKLLGTTAPGTLTLKMVFDDVQAAFDKSPNVSFRSYLAGIKPGPATAQALQDLQAAAAEIVIEVTKLARSIGDDLRDAVLAELDVLAKTILQTSFKTDQGPFNIGTAYGELLNERAEVLGNLPGAQTAITNTVRKSLFMPQDDIRSNVVTELSLSDPSIKPEDQDQLWADARSMQLYSQQTNDSKSKPISSPVQRHFLNKFFAEWADGRPTPVLILQKCGDLVVDLVKGDILQLIDLEAIREEIEDRIRSLIPVEIEMSFTFGMPLGPEVAPATANIFVPGPECRLDIKSIAKLQLMGKSGSGPSLDFSSQGTLGSFDIKLVGNFLDALTLKFGGASFSTKKGQSPRIDVDFLDYEIGKSLEFVQTLADALSPSPGSGPFIRPTFSPIGLEAGYTLPTFNFSIGAVAFSNIGLGASIVLPFTSDEARLKASLSSRPNPFTITYLPYGGSGFFSIEANAQGIVGFEASFEFGGSAVFAFGPLNGIGRLMVGVYIRQYKGSNGRTLTDISGTFFVGGSAKLWIFSFGASLYVRTGMTGDGKMFGEATFTFTFSMGIKDFNYSVSVKKEQPKNFGSDSGGKQAYYGLRFADNSTAPVGEMPLHVYSAYEPHITIEGVGPDENWPTYRRYFDHFATDERLLP